MLETSQCSHSPLNLTIQTYMLQAACSEPASSAVVCMYFSAHAIGNNKNADFPSHAIAVFLVKHRKVKRLNQAHLKWLLQECLMDKSGTSWLWRWQCPVTFHDECFGSWWPGMVAQSCEQLLSAMHFMTGSEEWRIKDILVIQLCLRWVY